MSSLGIRTSAVLLLVLGATEARAARPAGVAAHGGLEARSVAVRRAVRVAWNQVPQAAVVPWTRFLSSARGWQAVWDTSTGVPLRLFGRGLHAPGASADAAAATRHARAMLAAHAALLAPGARPEDFVEVANLGHRGVRTVGFRQHVAGLEVIGGQVSFRYKRDRLIAIGSEAMPGATAAVAAGRPVVDRAIGRLLAQTWMTSDLGGAVRAGAVAGPLVLPLIGEGGVLGYRTVLRVAVDSREPRGAWDVYVDAASGAPVARRQRLAFADGEVTFDAPVRRPGAERLRYPARRGDFTIDGVASQSSDAGVVSWSGAAAGTLTTFARGPLVEVANRDGENASAQFSIPASGRISWDASADDRVDAQLTAFIHAGVVKDFVRARIAPGLAWLDEQLPVNVNIDDECNAYSDGDSLNFFLGSAQCANTGRLPDVIYHEFGHALHMHSIIDGAGSFDGAFSEGLSDYLAASVTGDPAMGRGFFHDDSPLRHIDPTDREAAWPRDIGELHTTGLIFAGAMWDLRKLLIQKHGEAEGALMAERLWYGAVQRASSIPSTYVEILVEDDDDGDLDNGTPNVCDINAAFAPHGLRQVAVDLAPLGAEAVAADGFPVSLQVRGLLPQCAGDGVASASISWLLRGQRLDDAQTIDMDQVDGEWQGVIPAQPEGAVVRYQITLGFNDGSTQTLPDNPADPRLEFYVGEVVELYCTDFESDPFAAGWTHGLSRGDPAEGADDWAWGPPMASASSGDPPTAFSGASVLGNDLGGESDGHYQSDLTNHAISPVIETERYSDVRVQYRRWLNVEDGYFDQASLLANGEVAWKNFDSNDGDQSTTQHTDREWRFHDVPVSEFITDRTVQLTYQVSSDGGLEFGGWTVDDLCVVAAAGKVCGDGVMVEPEQCDAGDANSDSEPDACRESCRQATCGDGAVDSGETCDDGNTDDGDGCEATCAAAGDEGGDCGCQVGVGSGPSPGAGLLLGLGLAVLALLRRRRGL